MAEVFISYARTDKGFALDLNAALQKLQRDTWIDWRNIPDSAQWRAEIFANIEASDNFLFIISPESLRSKMCGFEVARAVANKKRIVTILYRPVDHDDLLPGLAEIQWINYPELGLEQTFQRLITAIDTDLEWVRQHTRFGLRAAQWKSNGRDNGFLLHGTELREAIRWLEQAPTTESRQPTEVHEQYIRASEEWEAGEIRRLEDLADKATKEAERQARIALARERVAFSTLSLEEDEERSIILSMHAVDATRSVDRTVVPESEDALHRAILRSRIGFVSASKDNMIRVWSEESSELGILQGHTDAVTGVAVSADGRLAVSASMDATLKLWDVESGRELRTLQGHSDAVWAVALSGDGRLAVSASADNTLKVWELGSGRELRSLRCHFPSAWSKDARLAVSARTVKVVDSVPRRRPQRALPGHSHWVNAVAVMPDGRLAVSASQDKTLKVWELGSGRELRTLTGHTDHVNGVAVTPDGQRAVSASGDRTLKVWELASGRAIHTFTSYTDSVNGVAVSGNGTRVASASEDQTVTIWDMEDGRELITLAAHDGAVYSVAWPLDGKRLLSGGADGIIQVYAMDIDLLMSLGRSRVTRNLTSEECRQYLHLDEVPPIP